MNRRFGLAAGLLLLLPAVRAEPAATAGLKPEELGPPEPPKPPRLILALPLGITAGTTNRITVRGQFLKDATALRLAGPAGTNDAVITAREDAAVPEHFKAAQAGDQQLQAELAVPAEVPAGTNLFLTVTTPGGESTLPLFGLGAEPPLETAPDNGGFRTAQPLPAGVWVRGKLDGRREVAVFRVEGRAGQRLRVELWARRLGSTLDAALTLHNARGAVLRSADDSAGRDPVLEAALPADGPYFISLANVEERAAPTHVYLLRLTTPP